MAPQYISVTVDCLPNDDLSLIVRDISKVPGKDYLIVDVRDEDFIGGHIKGARNIPIQTILDSRNNEFLVSELKDIPKVIFHCALSQVRGPKAALTYSRLTENNESQEIFVLRGGFVEWQQKFARDVELTEDYDEETWKDPFE
ncbi:hypothetical protein HK098_005224 [Nowakowskiella sp. JEL0407]|nr:hypothetical protein HK098_005224 [Nowakowskiella sp. JEL0407]